MTSAEQLLQTVVEALQEIAPEADLSRVDRERSLRAQLDIDSFDFLRLLIALQERTGVEVPEAEYRRVDSLSGLVACLSRHAKV